MRQVHTDAHVEATVYGVDKVNYLVTIARKAV